MMLLVIYMFKKFIEEYTNELKEKENKSTYNKASLISLIFIYISYLIYKYGHFLSFMQFLMHFIFARMHLRKFLLPLYDFLRETCYKL